jgi:RecA/RadA recombinase
MARRKKKEGDPDFDSLVPSKNRESMDRAGVSWSPKYIEAAGEIDDWDSADEVLDNIVSVRTVFPDFNNATHVGGLPVRRIHTIHGPTHGGKTAFALGLAKSFADVGYLTGVVDAEYALGKEFAAEIVTNLKSKPNFLASRPKTYEETISKVDSFLHKAGKVKETFSEAKSFLLIDSINKLVPKRELEKILKQGQINEKGAKELTKGHHARYRAALNQAWLDQLTPKIWKADCALVLIAQERGEDDPSDFFNENFKVKGGAALLFDASLVMRVMKSTPIFIKPSELKSNNNICGFAHRVRIWKSKVSHMEGRYTDCIFHISNGRLTTPGLDIGRDAMSLGIRFGLIKVSGPWYEYNGYKLQGFNAMLKVIYKDSDLLFNLLNEINIHIDKNAGRI